MEKTKQFDISKQLFMQAYKLVKANHGAAGIDKESLEDFEMDWKNNLYKLWNRMSSGSYFPSPVKAVPIPKKSGGVRLLGIPSVGDRICQMVVKLVFEPNVEAIFLKDSYGYRPNKSALDAIGVTRQRCWVHDFILEFDIYGLFDNLSHDLLMKAVQKHSQVPWVILYIKRWLKAPMQKDNGETIERTRGVPQGGVISPVLSNLFLHYVFDLWMQRQYSEMEWCRYADDGVVHCDNIYRAKELLDKLSKRFAECELQMHPDKTRIVYCKDNKRRGMYPNRSFDFLGYTFRARTCKNSKNNTLFTSFTPAVSKQAMKSMRAKIKALKISKRTDLNIAELAKLVNPILQGWFNYYGKYHRTALIPVGKHFNSTLITWIRKKYKSLKYSKTKAGRFLSKIAKEQPTLFVHWGAGII